MSLGGIVVAGGAGLRLGGDGKAGLDLNGRTLLEHALAALDEVEDVIVAGDPVPTERPARFVREQPPGGGPAAGLLAAVDAFSPLPLRVLVLAVDMPRVSAATFRRLMLQVTGDGAVLVDEEGRRQLCGVFATAALQAADPGPGQRAGLPVHRLLAGLRLAEVPAIGNEAYDIDTPADLHRLRREERA